MNARQTESAPSITLNGAPLAFSESSAPNEIAEAINRLTTKDSLVARTQMHVIEVKLQTKNAFSITLKPAVPKFWRNFTLMSTSPLKAKTIEYSLVEALANRHDWVGRIAWQSPRKRNQGRIAGLIAFAMFGIPYAIFGGHALYTKAPGVDAKTFWIGFIAIAVMAGYMMWIDFFFGSVRVRAAKTTGRWLGGKVSESHGLDAGTWNVETPKEASLGRTLYANLLVGFIDLSVLLAGVVLPVAVGGVALFLVFDK